MVGEQNRTRLEKTLLKWVSENRNDTIYILLEETI